MPLGSQICTNAFLNLGKEDTSAKARNDRAPETYAAIAALHGGAIFCEPSTLRAERMAAMASRLKPRLEWGLREGQACRTSSYSSWGRRAAVDAASERKAATALHTLPPPGTLFGCYSVPRDILACEGKEWGRGEEKQVSELSRTDQAPVISPPFVSKIQKLIVIVITVK